MLSALSVILQIVSIPVLVHIVGTYNKENIRGLPQTAFLLGGLFFPACVSLVLFNIVMAFRVRKGKV